MELTKKVTISPGSHKTIVFKIKIPKSGFPGIIAGGIYVRKELTANQKKSSTPAYCYVKSICRDNTRATI